jgi:hypothetical protein
MLIEILLVREEQRTSELPAAQYLPIFINPTYAFMKKLGDLLGAHYDQFRFYVNLTISHLIFIEHPI